VKASDPELASTTGAAAVVGSAGAEVGAGSEVGSALLDGEDPPLTPVAAVDVGVCAGSVVPSVGTVVELAAAEAGSGSVESCVVVDEPVTPVDSVVQHGVVGGTVVGGAETEDAEVAITGAALGCVGPTVTMPVGALLLG
jgi:hypothetical protein